MKKYLKEFIYVSLFFVLLSVLFYSPVLFGKIPLNGNLLVTFWSPWKFMVWDNFPTGVPFKFVAIDEVREFYPILNFNFENLRQGMLPLWNPYNFSGYPHMANWASAIFYPLHLIMLVLGEVESFIFLKASSIFLAGMFTYLYLRNIGQKVLSSMFGAVAFSLSATMLIWGYEIWQSAHSFLWLPLLLFGIEKLTETKKRIYIIPISLAIGFSVLGGYIQPTIYLLMLGGTYSLLKIFTKENKSKIIDLLNIFVAFVLGFGLSAVQIFPGVEGYLLSPRSLVQLKELNISFLLPLNQVVTFLVPDFYGHIATFNWLLKRPGQYYENMIYVGLVPLIVSFIAINSSKLRKLTIFFFAWGIISFLMTLDIPTSRMVYELSIPFLSSAIPIRIVFVLAFCISVLSSIGLGWWIDEKNLKKLVISLIPISFIFVGIGIYILNAKNSNLQISGFPQDWVNTPFRNYVYPALFFVASIAFLIIGQVFVRVKLIIAVLLIGLTIASSYLYFNKYAAFSEKSFLYPNNSLLSFISANSGFDRYWGYGSANIANNYATIYKFYSPEGYDPVNIVYYNELLSSSRKGKYEGIFSRSDALLYPVTNFPFEKADDSRYKLMDLLGVKYVGFEKGELEKISKERINPQRFKKIYDENNFIIYENMNSYPRAFIVGEQIVKEGKDAIGFFYSSSFNASRSAIVDERLPIESGEGMANIVTYKPSRIEIDANASSPSLLVLTDAYYPGWEALVNNVKSKVIRVDYGLKGVVVPEGESKVVLTYNPLSLRGGFVVSVISIILLSFIYIYGRKNKRNKS